MRVIVREPSASFRDALSSHPQREQINPDRAIAQHRAFVAALAAAGLDVVPLPPEPALPDGPFVSDMLVALPRADDPDGPTALLVVTRPGAPSRRGEVASVAARAQELAPDVEVIEVQEAGTLEGGDVVVFGDRVAIGVSGRTNVCGAGQLALAAGSVGYRASLCPVTDRLHLASAVTPLGPRRLLGTAAGFASLDRAPGSAPADEVERLLVPDEEPGAANVLALGGHVFMAAGHPRTAGLLRASGEDVIELELDEFARADGGPTCLVAIIP
jgi:dimethylargininase